MPTFTRLELENFKNYRQKTIIEWKQVSSVLGQNGTGKSTIVDAIEYVFGFPRYTRRSVDSLKAELYNKNSSQDAHSSTWVKAIINTDKGVKEFKRLVDYKASAHKYWVDNGMVDLAEYNSSLLQVNINPRANNFLVQQHSIESLALKNAKQRSEFFELLSNSITYKALYDSLITQQENMKTEVKTLQRTLNCYTKEKRNLIEKNNELKKYDELHQQLEQVEYDYCYVKLYQIQTSIGHLVHERQKKQPYLAVTEKLMNEYKEQITKLKNEINEKEKEIAEIETNLEKRELNYMKNKKKGIELAEKISHCENEIKKVEKNLKKAEEIDFAHKKTLNDLNKQYREVEEKKNEFNKSLSQSCSLQLEDNQYEEYLQLKAEAQKQFVQENQSSSALERELDNLKDKIDQYKTKKDALMTQINKEICIQQEMVTQKENVNKKCLETSLAYQDVKKNIIELDEKIKQVSQNVEDLISDIQNINGTLVDYALNKNRRRQIEIANALKTHFRGVYGRLVDLCNVHDKKYEIAITKILGKRMDGIVVDTTNTAQKCIQFLKKQYWSDKDSAVATFFPLDNLKPKNSSAVLRTIQTVPYAKLAVDVMNARKIDTVLRSFIGDVVICETDDQAMDFSQRHGVNCVSLNGSYFKKDGTFSGGCSDMRQKAKEWSEAEYESLETEKGEKTVILRKLQLEIREKQQSKNELQMKSISLQRRSEYLEQMLKEHNQKIQSKEQEIRKLKNDLETLVLGKSEIDELQKLFSEINEKICNIRVREKEIEDEVFASFCERFQLENIRKYEESDGRIYEERLKCRTEYENHLDVIKNQIELEESRNTKATVEQYQKKLDSLKNVYQNLLQNKRDFEKRKNDYNEHRANKAKVESIRRDIDQITKALETKQRELSAAERNSIQLKNDIAALTADIDQLRCFEKHRLLTNCKINGIDIPLRNGTIEKLVVKSRVADTESEVSGSSSNKTESDTELREKDVDIDFAQLDESIRVLKESELTEHIESLDKQQKEIKEKLNSYIQSNQILKYDLESIQSRIKHIKKNLISKKEEFAIVMKDFEEVKNKRRNSFIDFCDVVEEKIDQIFKNLYDNPAAQACIIKTNPDEPYLDGIGLSFLIPNKNFAMIEQLSGGEKTMCAMALFLATYCAKPAPCIIFDEIDAALDNTNLRKIANLYIQWKTTTQIISISHNNLLFRSADAAIGINISNRKNTSYVIHLDLSRYRPSLTSISSRMYSPRTPTNESPIYSRRSDPISETPKLPSLSSSGSKLTDGQPKLSSSSRPTSASTSMIKSVEECNIDTRRKKSKRPRKSDS